MLHKYANGILILTFRKHNKLCIRTLFFINNQLSLTKITIYFIHIRQIITQHYRKQTKIINTVYQLVTITNKIVQSNYQYIIKKRQTFIQINKKISNSSHYHHTIKH